MKNLLLLCDVRAGATCTAAADALRILARISLILRHAREAQWCIAHVSRSNRGRPRPSLPGYEPLPSEAVFSVDEGASFAARALTETHMDCDGVAAAGFAFPALAAPALIACADAGLPATLLEDATELGPGAEFSIHALRKKGVRLLSAEALIASRIATTRTYPRS